MSSIDSIGVLPVRIDFHAASSCNTRNPGLLLLRFMKYLLSWVAPRTCSSHCSAEKFTARRKNSAVPEYEVEGSALVSRDLGTDDEQDRAVLKTVVVVRSISG